VLAGPDGKILSTVEGYTEASRFQEQLQRTLAGLSNPEWMSRDYDEAAKAVAASEYARAVSLLKNVLEDNGDRPVQVKARQLLTDIEQQGASRLAQAKQLEDKGQTPEALDTLTQLAR